MFHKLTKRPKFHDAACQGNLKFCQGIVREMSGNFVSSEVWQPCSNCPRHTLRAHTMTQYPLPTFHAPTTQNFTSSKILVCFPIHMMARIMKPWIVIALDMLYKHAP